MIKPGIYPDLSNEDYHADSAISRSHILMFDDCPLKYWAHYLSPNRPSKESTKEMMFGSAFHSFVLEPDLFLKQYAFAPEKITLKYSGREAYDKYKAECLKLEKSKKIIISDEDGNLLLDMRHALKENKEAWALIENARYETSFFWKDKDTGLMCKARPDILHNNMIVDLKTCKSASSRAFQYAMVEGMYDVQAAMCAEGIYQNTGNYISSSINICIEKTYPYAIGIKIISDDALKAGHEKFKQKLHDIKLAKEYNVFKSYETEIVELPKWIK